LLWTGVEKRGSSSYLTVGQFIGFLQRGGGSSSGHFLFKVQSDIAQFLLDVTNDFTLSCWSSNQKRRTKKKKNSVNFRFKQIVVKVGWDFEGGCFLPVVVKL
jgi:hypothetical protein